MTVYIKYAKSVGIFFATLTLIGSIGTQAFSVYANTWLSEWSADVDNVLPHKRDMYLGVYGAMGILQTLFQFVTAIAMAIGCLNAARDIHDNLLQQTLRLPMSFFDTTPLGRIVNRFAKDMDIVDTMIPMLMRMAISMIFSVSITIRGFSFVSQEIVTYICDFHTFHASGSRRFGCHQYFDANFHGRHNSAWHHLLFHSIVLPGHLTTVETYRIGNAIAGLFAFRRNDYRPVNN